MLSVGALNLTPLP